MKFKNLGAQKLALGIAALPGEERSIRRVAKRLGQDYAAVWRWLNEDQCPEYPGRKATLEQFGVDLDDWDLPPSKELSKKLGEIEIQVGAA